MARTGAEWLTDILQAIADIEEFTAGMDTKSFASADRKTLLAVQALFSNIGEAVKGLPHEVRTRNAHVPWHRISGLRNLLVHEYFRKDTDIIWHIISDGPMTQLKAAVIAELARLDT